MGESEVRCQPLPCALGRGDGSFLYASPTFPARWLVGSPQVVGRVVLIHRADSVSLVHTSYIEKVSAGSFWQMPKWSKSKSNQFGFFASFPCCRLSFKRWLVLRMCVFARIAYLPPSSSAFLLRFPTEAKQNAIVVVTSTQAPSKKSTKKQRC